MRTIFDKRRIAKPEKAERRTARRNKSERRAAFA